MRCIAFDADGTEIANRVYYSVGGGFIVSDEVAAGDGALQTLIVRGPSTMLLSRIDTAKVFGATSPSAQLSTPLVAKKSMPLPMPCC